MLGYLKLNNVFCMFWKAMLWYQLTMYLKKFYSKYFFFLFCCCIFLFCLLFLFPAICTLCKENIYYIISPDQLLWWEIMCFTNLFSNKLLVLFFFLLIDLEKTISQKSWSLKFACLNNGRLSFWQTSQKPAGLWKHWIEIIKQVRSGQIFLNWEIALVMIVPYIWPKGEKTIF